MNTLLIIIGIILSPIIARLILEYILLIDETIIKIYWKITGVCTLNKEETAILNRHIESIKSDCSKKSDEVKEVGYKIEVPNRPYFK